MVGEVGMAPRLEKSVDGVLPHCSWLLDSQRAVPIGFMSLVTSVEKGKSQCVQCQSFRVKGYVSIPSIESRTKVHVPPEQVEIKCACSLSSNRYPRETT